MWSHEGPNRGWCAQPRKTLQAWQRTDHAGQAPLQGLPSTCQAAYLIHNPNPGTGNARDIPSIACFCWMEWGVWNWHPQAPGDVRMFAYAALQDWLAQA
jgi:hypothetical protein